jgi:hypothetical protein
MDDNRFYLHEVTPIKNLQDAVFVTNLSHSSSAHLGDIAKVLQNIVTAKSDSSKVVDENGEPLVVYHGSEAEFTIFDSSFNHKSNKGFFFTNSDAMARSYGNTKSFFLNIRDSYDIEGNGRNWQTCNVEWIIGKRLLKEVETLLQSRSASKKSTKRLRTLLSIIRKWASLSTSTIMC